MRFGFAFGVGGERGRAIVENACVTLGKDATWYGSDGVFGSVTPDATITNQSIFALKWKADGVFIIQFGDAGDEQVPDVPQIFLYTTYEVPPTIAIWDETNSYYTSTNLTLATDLIEEQDVNGATEICFNIEIEPVTFITYDYNLETA